MTKFSDFFHHAAPEERERVMLDVIDRACKLQQERCNAMRNPYPCPVCETIQVQLVDIGEMLSFKCRHCNHEFQVKPVPKTVT